MSEIEIMLQKLVLSANAAKKAKPAVGKKAPPTVTNQGKPIAKTVKKIPGKVKAKPPTIVKTQPTVTKQNSNKSNFSRFWKNLTKKQQQQYIAQHPRTKKKPTSGKQGGRRWTKMKHQLQRMIHPGQSAKNIPPTKTKSNPATNNQQGSKPANKSAVKPSIDLSHVATIKTNHVLQNIHGSLTPKQQSHLHDAIKTIQHQDIKELSKSQGRALSRAVILTMVAAAGFAVAGPVGAFVAAHALAEYHHEKTQVGFVKFAYHALKGKKFHEISDDDENAHQKQTNKIIEMLHSHIKTLAAKPNPTKADEAELDHLEKLIYQIQHAKEQYDELHSKKGGFFGNKGNSGNISTAPSIPAHHGYRGHHGHHHKKHP